MASHFTFCEREILYRLLRAKKSKAEIAELMGRSRSTIYREIERNTGGRGYRPKQAQRKAEERRLPCRREPRMNDRTLRSSVTRLLKKAWSPDQIAKRLRREHPRTPGKYVSHQTIYTWIAREAPELRAHLRRRGKRRSGPEKRGQLVGCVGIGGRPKAVDSRRRFGDWEGDTVVSPGRRSGVVTMVDRKSGYVRIRKTASLKATATRRAARRSLGDLPESLRRTMTLDNGKEFAEHRQLAEELGLDIYFAKPYASWQRGTNEHTNGLLRQFFPKKTDFARISHHAVARAEKLLNERPRKRLGYRTPQEVLAKKLRCN
jgi:transposase, IS30 family